MKPTRTFLWEGSPTPMSSTKGDAFKWRYEIGVGDASHRRRRIRRSFGALGSIFVLLMMTSPANALPPLPSDDFEDGTVQSWGGSPTSNVPNSGPAGTGDNALRVASGNRVVVMNQSQWTGNYAAAGIKQISMDVQHQNAFPLALRLGIANGPLGPGGSGDTYVTDDAVAVANDGLWHRITFNVKAADFVATSSNTSITPDAAAALANVTVLRLLHNPNPMDFTGAIGPATFFLDNIAASTVPEPVAVGLLIAGFVGVAGCGRAQRRLVCRAS